MSILIHGVYSNMSAIVAVCSPNFCLLMADKRLVELKEYKQDTPTVVSDNFSKIKQLNQNVAYGMTGKLFVGEPITSAIEKVIDVKHAYADEITYAVIKYLNDRKYTLILPRNYFIGGKRSDGQFCLYTISLNSDTYKIDATEYSFEKNTGIRMALSIPPSLKNEYSTYMERLEKEVKESKDTDEIINKVHKIICSVADKDVTVNKVCDGIMIK